MWPTRDTPWPPGIPQVDVVVASNITSSVRSIKINIYYNYIFFIIDMLMIPRYTRARLSPRQDADQARSGEGKEERHGKGGSHRDGTGAGRVLAPRRRRGSG